MNIKYVIAYDVGTTAVKGVLVSSEGEIIESESINIETIYESGNKEQQPEKWYSAVCEISKKFTLKVLKEDIIGVIMSGQMQDLILVDRNGDSISNAILYSDGRASEEAKEIQKKIGKEELYQVLGNQLDGSFPLSKLLWIKNNNPEIYRLINKIMISSKDYCVGKLTGRYITDTTSATTSGIMDIRSKEFRVDWLTRLGIEDSFLPDLCRPDHYIGGVSKQASLESGLHENTRIYAGIGDAGATTLASGINHAGEININLGTSGWVAEISDHVLEKEGVFNLVSADAKNYINIVPFLNSGNVHQWVAETFAGGISQSLKYEEIGKKLKFRRPGSGNLLFLPYIVGERFPIMDNNIKGAYYGITQKTTDIDLISAAMEGVAYSLRQGLEEICENPTKVTLIGGGAKESVWCQIISDVLGQNITAFLNTEYLPALSICEFVFYDCKVWGDTDDFPYRFVRKNQTITYYPNFANKELYDFNFHNFKTLYPRLKGI